MASGRAPGPDRPHRPHQAADSQLGQIILMHSQGTAPATPHHGHEAATLHAHQKCGPASGMVESQRMFPEAAPAGKPAWSWVEGGFMWCFLAKHR